MSYAKNLTVAKYKAECAITSDPTPGDLPSTSSKTLSIQSNKQNKQKQNKKQNKKPKAGKSQEHRENPASAQLNVSAVFIERLITKISQQMNPENLGSDHFLIHIIIDGTILHEDVRMHRINLKKVDWKLYQLTFLASLGPDLPTDDLEQNTTLISKCIVEAAVASSPKPKNCIRKEMVPYWNDDCRSAIKERNQKRNRFLKSRTDEAFVEYKRAKGRAQWVIKTAKRE